MKTAAEIVKEAILANVPKGMTFTEEEFDLWKDAPRFKEEFPATLAAMKAYAKQALEEAAERASNADTFCNEAIRRRLVDKTNCGKFCEGCERIFDKSSILNIIDELT